jgi:hypothetical protein
VSMVGDGCTFFFVVEVVILVSGWRGHWKGGGLVLYVIFFQCVFCCS